MWLDKNGNYTKDYMKAVWFENRITAVIYSPTIYQLVGNCEDPGKHPHGLKRVEYTWKKEDKSGKNFFYCDSSADVKAILEHWSVNGWKYKLAS